MISAAFDDIFTYLLVIYFFFYFLILPLPVLWVGGSRCSWFDVSHLVWTQVSICVSIGSDQVRLVTMCLHRWDSEREQSEVFGKSFFFFFFFGPWLLFNWWSFVLLLPAWLLFFSGFVQLHRILNPVKLSSGIFFMHLSLSFFFF